jgi:hypothetical protein
MAVQMGILSPATLVLFTRVFITLFPHGRRAILTGPKRKAASERGLFLPRARASQDWRIKPMPGGLGKKSFHSTVFDDLGQMEEHPVIAS